MRLLQTNEKIVPAVQLSTERTGISTSAPSPGRRQDLHRHLYRHRRPSTHTDLHAAQRHLMPRCLRSLRAPPGNVQRHPGVNSGYLQLIHGQLPLNRARLHIRWRCFPIVCGCFPTIRGCLPMSRRHPPLSRAYLQISQGCLQVSRRRLQVIGGRRPYGRRQWFSASTCLNWPKRAVKAQKR